MDAITLRFLERILAVAVGGMAIYLGYRLFLKVPEGQNGEGKFILPWDTSIALSRVGPGVFFALFGASVVGVSFLKPIEYHPNQGFIGASSLLVFSDREARADGRAALQKEIAILNNFARKLRPDLLVQDRAEVQLAIPRIKFALMRPVWGELSEGWGDQAEFEEWLRQGEPDPPPESLEKAVEYYRYGSQQVTP